MHADPLSRYPALHTSRVDEFEHLLRAVYGARGFDLQCPSSLSVRGNFARLSDIALGFGACGTAATIDFEETDFARLQMPLRGEGKTTSGRQSAIIGAGDACLASPGQSSVLDYGVDFEHLFLRVSSAALRRKLAVLLDRPARREIEFELAQFSSPALLSGLQRMVGLLASQLDDEQAIISPLALREIEQAIILQLLFASRHTYSDLLAGDPRSPAPLHLRRVEAYIEGNWNRPILIENLVELAGVSARSLYDGFEKAYGCSPMAYVKQIRLRRAYELLTNAGESTTVTGVAFTCGFSNLGHFANDYRSTFGEFPSDTLRRAHAII